MFHPLERIPRPSADPAMLITSDCVLQLIRDNLACNLACLAKPRQTESKKLPCARHGSPIIILG
ncbi:uncharacterized protein PgNI_03951 [Pyricularia grisea]|uniref:Uncharacterized protein n=1 Tax=Pyricularia grisea TaxID=148305 RepID=A0A6P8BFD4_PYRGI|nr:uncharacterized protein PgNI_03951 [Pyricularia grisea]TLD14427.1 hypothetical protein PgNI_03951 [Pyricularia grisea]